MDIRRVSSLFHSHTELTSPGVHLPQSSHSSWYSAKSPSSSLYLPAGQSVQFVDPALGATLPSPQTAQFSLDGAAKRLEYFPAEQFVQFVPPTASLYVPPMHFVQLKALVVSA